MQQEQRDQQQARVQNIRRAFLKLANSREQEKSLEALALEGEALLEKQVCFQSIGQ